MFYLLICAVGDVIGFIIFSSSPKVAGFAVIVVLAMRSTAIYALSQRTVSHRVLCKVPLVCFMVIWQWLSPLRDKVPLDPHYRWFFKEPSMTMKSPGGSTVV